MKAQNTRGFKGSVIENNGYWYLLATLPGETKRRKHPLRAPGAKAAMRTDRPKEAAIAAAHRLWERAAIALNPVRRHEVASVADVCDAWLRHVPAYYKGDGGKYTTPVRTIREMYGERSPGELRHADMLAVREAFIAKGWARSHVNACLWVVRAFWGWALDEALVSATVKAELTQVKGLKRGRCAAHETPPVRQIGDAALAATLGCLTPATADMVRVHRLTGMRPGELCAMRWELIDTASEPWIYRPSSHKNDWRGQPRAICIGPKAREILNLRRKPTGFCFSPMESVREILDARIAAGHCHRPPEKLRNYADAERRPGETWEVRAYSRAIRKAAIKAGVEPWSANRLRHAFATEVRRKFGLEACRAVLGHSMGASVTDRYSFDAIEEEMIAKAAPAVEALG